ASSATYRAQDGLIADAAADTPRLHYDAAGNPEGILLEGAAATLNTVSEWRHNPVLWLGNGSRAGDTRIGPNGRTDFYEENIGGTTSQGNFTIPTTSADYAISLFVPKSTTGEITHFRAYLQYGTSPDIYARGDFNRQTGVFTLSHANFTRLDARDWGAHWRIEMVMTSTDQPLLVLGVDQVGSDPIIYGGLNIVAASSVTSYMECANAVGTRAADTYGFQTPRPSKVAGLLSAAKVRPVDILAFGDSRHGGAGAVDGGIGLNGGAHRVLAAEYGLYATPVLGCGPSAQQRFQAPDVGSVATASATLADGVGNAALANKALIDWIGPAQISGDIANDSFDTTLNNSSVALYDRSAAWRWHLAHSTQPGGGAAQPRVLMGGAGGNTSFSLDASGFTDEAVFTADIPADPTRTAFGVKLRSAETEAVKGPIDLFWQRWENVDTPAGLSYTTFWAQPGGDINDAKSYFDSQSATAVDNTLKAVTHIQRARGHEPTLIVVISLMGNTSTISAADWKAQTLALYQAIKANWLALGYPDWGIACLINDYHPVDGTGTADRAYLLERIAAAKALDAAYDDIAYVSMHSQLTTAQLEANAWYLDSVSDRFHLTELGYSAAADIDWTLAKGDLGASTVVISGRFPGGTAGSNALLALDNDATSLAAISAAPSDGLSAVLYDREGATATTITLTGLGDDRFGFALTLAQEDIRWSINGGAVASDTSATLGAWDRLAFTPEAAIILDRIALYDDVSADTELTLQSAQLIAFPGTQSFGTSSSSLSLSAQGLAFGSPEDVPLADLAFVFDASPMIGKPTTAKRVLAPYGRPGPVTPDI
ncbi:MAG: hypothetical protein AAF562_02740, partial [Pseudomonadota bacterium]